MSWREWLVSLLVVAVVGIKVAEGVYSLEAWPLSSVPMFSRRIPPERTLWRIALLGSRGGAEIELSAADFGLSPDELGRWIGRPFETLPERCAQLGNLYNANPRFAATPLTSLRVRATKVLRPGVPGLPFEVAWPCPLAPPAGR